MGWYFQRWSRLLWSTNHVAVLRDVDLQMGNKPALSRTAQLITKNKIQGEQAPSTLRFQMQAQGKDSSSKGIRGMISLKIKED